MSYSSQAAHYRETQVMTASPAQLVVILYDHVLVCLRRARIAMEAGNTEQRILLLDKARHGLGELLATLNHDEGGVIAQNLARLYTFLLSELIDIGRTSDVARLERVTGIVTELRGAFAALAGEQE
jgi:flagellar protein FliS